MKTYEPEELDHCAPRVGDQVIYRSIGGRIKKGTVTAIRGNLCDVDYGEGQSPEDTGFIWRFRDGLNNLHDWPTKDPVCECSRS